MALGPPIRPPAPPPPPASHEFTLTPVPGKPWLARDQHGRLHGVSVRPDQEN
jgi:hypothetical protein